ncbi:MAG TPA: hypothetical protein VNV87_14250 [Acidimicrobiales bacterium]|jgi:hypothetical protein|nr:hypothetical protein [Acidimicrobiales bacterium]
MPDVPRLPAAMPDTPRSDALVGTDSPHTPVAFPDDAPVGLLLHQLPEFEAAYIELVDTFDDAPGGASVFTELADFVSSRLTAVESERPVLERALGAVEMVADGQDAESAELVGYAFLDSLSPEDRRRIRPWLGPRTRSLLDELDSGSGGGGLLG